MLVLVAGFSVVVWTVEEVVLVAGFSVVVWTVEDVVLDTGFSVVVTGTVDVVLVIGFSVVVAVVVAVASVVVVVALVVDGSFVPHPPPSAQHTSSCQLKFAEQQSRSVSYFVSHEANAVFCPQLSLSLKYLRSPN